MAQDLVCSFRLKSQNAKFLGDIIHKEKTDTSEHKVIVKAINYKVNDEEFNEIKYDYRGNPLYSTMISKLCNYNRRSEFILNILFSLNLINL